MSKTKQKSIDELLEEALVPEEEQPYKVPENWIWTRLGNLVHFIGGGTPSKTVKKYWDGNIPWATVKDIKGKYLLQTKDSITEEGLNNSSASLAAEEELIVVTRMSPGKAIISNIKTAINQDLKIVKPKTKIHSGFLWIFFEVNRPLIESLSTGSTVKGIQIKKLDELLISLPPYEEQKRIAEKIERLFANIDEAKRLIEEVKESFELRKISIIKRIIDEGKEDAQQRGWKFDAIKDIFEIKGGGTPSKSNESYWNGTIPWVTPKDMKTLYIQETKDYITEEGLNNSSAKMVTKGSIAMVVRSGILQHSLPVAYLMTDGTVNQDLKVFNSGDELVNKYFLWYVKANEKYLLNEYSKAGTTVNSIEFEKFKSHIIPIPPREEIEKKITNIESIINKEHDINMYVDQISQLENLKYAILHKAFRGELGANDPTDEHAIELLKEVLKTK